MKVAQLEQRQTLRTRLQGWTEKLQRQIEQMHLELKVLVNMGQNILKQTFNVFSPGNLQKDIKQRREASGHAGEKASRHGS